jgi:hypothetical protein
VSIIEKAANKFEQIKGKISPQLKVQPEIQNKQSSKFAHGHNANNQDKPTLAQVDINLARLHQ